MNLLSTRDFHATNSCGASKLSSSVELSVCRGVCTQQPGLTGTKSLAIRGEHSDILLLAKGDIYVEWEVRQGERNMSLG